MAKAAQDLQKGDSVSWNWQGSHPKGKVEEVVEGKATTKTKNGNEISINGDESNPAVKIKTGSGNAAVKPVSRHRRCLNFLSSTSSSSILTSSLYLTHILLQASNIDGVSTGKGKSEKKDGSKDDKDDQPEKNEKKNNNKQQKKGTSQNKKKDEEKKDEGEGEDQEEKEEDSNPKKSGNKRTASQVKESEADQEEGDAEEYVPSKDEAKAADEDEKDAAQSEEEVDEKDGEGEAGDEDGEGVGEADGEVVEEPATKKAKTENGSAKKDSKQDPKATRSLPARGAKEEVETLDEDKMLEDEELEGDD